MRGFSIVIWHHSTQKCSTLYTFIKNDTTNTIYRNRYIDNTDKKLSTAFNAIHFCFNFVLPFYRKIHLREEWKKQSSFKTHIKTVATVLFITTTYIMHIFYGAKIGLKKFILLYPKCCSFVAFYLYFCSYFSVGLLKQRIESVYLFIYRLLSHNPSWKWIAKAPQF